MKNNTNQTNSSKRKSIATESILNALGINPPMGKFSLLSDEQLTIEFNNVKSKTSNLSSNDRKRIIFEYERRNKN